MAFHIRLSSLISIFLILCIPILTAQTPLSEASRRADIQPAWPGCEPKLPDCTKSRMADFVAANLQIPPAAKAESAGGVVMMEFVVEKNGNIGEARPMHDPGLGLGEEATRVINLMKTKKIKWTPAVENGKKVAYRFIAPVSFNLMLPPKEKSAAEETQPVSESPVYHIVDQMPMYAGCETESTDSTDCTFMKLLEHIKTHMKYPELAYKNRVQGQVVVDFVINLTGAVINPVVRQGIGYGCDEEALRLISIMPAWIPGKQNGEAVAVKMTLPFFFQLPKEKD